MITTTIHHYFYITSIRYWRFSQSRKRWSRNVR